MLPASLPGGRRAPVKWPYIAALLCFGLRRLVLKRLPRKVPRRKRRRRTGPATLRRGHPRARRGCWRRRRAESRPSAPGSLRSPSRRGGRHCGSGFSRFGAPHLVGIRHRLVPGIGKFELLLVIVPGRDEFRRPLLHADALDFPPSGPAARTAEGWPGAGIRRCGSGDGGPFPAPSPHARARPAAPRRWRQPAPRR